MVENHTKRVMVLVEQLGFKINYEKSELIPTQEISFLGYRYFLARGIVAPTEERWNKIQEANELFLAHDWLTARTWQSLIGLLAATEKLVLQGLLHIRPLQLALLEAWSPIYQDQEECVKVTSEVVQSWFGGRTEK